MHALIRILPVIVLLWSSMLSCARIIEYDDFESDIGEAIVDKAKKKVEDVKQSFVDDSSSILCVGSR